jgi:hypothetical protein
MMLVALWACGLGAPGCFFSDRDPDPPPTPDLVVAVGARVTVTIDRCGTPSSAATICVDFDPQEVTSVNVKSDRFEIGAYTLDGWRGQLEVHARRVGDADLQVRLSGFHGDEVRTLRIRAAEITRTELVIRCEARPRAPEIFAVVAGAVLDFSTRALAGETEVASGDLELVTAPGFTLTAPGDDGRQATVPGAAGDYTWTLVGGSTVDFRIYDAADLGLALATSGGAPTFVTVSPVVGAVPICQHVGDLRARVEVVSGGCLPAMAYAEVVGPLPLDLRDGPADLELATAAATTCTVEARLDSGAVVSAAFDAAPAAAPRAPVWGEPLLGDGVTIAFPLPPESSCSGSLSDGDCDGVIDNFPFPPTDGDCYMNSEWSIRNRDGSRSDTDEIQETESLGIGLSTELRLLIRGFVLGFIPITVGPPINLDLSVSPSGALTLDPLGCSASTRDLAYRLVALQEGPIAMTFHADNLGDTGRRTIRARAIARPTFATLDEETDATLAGSLVEVFPASELLASVGYAASDGTPLRGTAPVRVTSDSTTALGTDTGRIFTGLDPGPTVAIIAPSAGSQQQTIRVVGASAIAGVSGLTDETVTYTPNRCVKLSPLGTGGLPIHGRRPTRPRLTLTGDAFVMGRSYRGEFCLAGFAFGSATVALTWGTGQVQATWTYAP